VVVLVVGVVVLVFGGGCLGGWGDGDGGGGTLRDIMVRMAISCLVKMYTNRHFYINECI
jgi:hypothetical protein